MEEEGPLAKCDFCNTRQIYSKYMYVFVDVSIGMINGVSIFKDVVQRCYKF